MKKQLVLLLAVGLMGSVVAEANERRRQQAPKRTTSYEEPAYRSSSSGGGHRMAGCGLGSMVVEDQGKWAQVGAAFLNGTGMQTFGITFGTSNCTEDGVASAAREKDAFVEANLADIRRDVAAGEGEYLSSLASFYGCQGHGSFAEALQRNQDKLGVSAEEASSVIDAVVKAEGVGCQG